MRAVRVASLLFLLLSPALVILCRQFVSFLRQLSIGADFSVGEYFVANLHEYFILLVAACSIAVMLMYRLHSCLSVYW